MLTLILLDIDSDLSLDLPENGSHKTSASLLHLASLQELPVTSFYRKWPNQTDTLPIVEVILCPSYDNDFGFSWSGPNLFSRATSTDDLFCYVSTFLVLDRVDWLMIQLLKLNGAGCVVEQFVYSLPQTEYVHREFDLVKGQLYDIIWGQDVSEDNPIACRFQMVIYPRLQLLSTLPTSKSALYSPRGPAFNNVALNPVFFVQNIVQGFGE